ncbi:pyroglutamyl-peptidase I [Vineibacter terrae]|uniref:pyroglutamyl-peptidase I n=1 Tax=Vineibacter terrae TaxID=2586908 RepID=UPI002E2F4B80|nr:pyroglutamyl-peptidase I [Vineibacter terrae]HEX2890757.1 pyroglutamyl-peptidase I [Vineibacter terrae]
MKRVLVTGFEPFDGESINPAWEVARRLDGWRSGSHAVVARRLPCAFGAVRDVLDHELTALAPEIAICVGQAGGRVDVSLERIAINVDDARIADNDGAQPIDRPVVAGAPAAYFTTLPVKAILQRLRRAGLPAQVSNTAGTFVCNHTFYMLRHLAETTHRGVHRTGFIHIPYLPEQAARHPGSPSLALDTLIAALRIAIETSVEVSDDIQLAAGALH